jgi:hypothetical protein
MSSPVDGNQYLSTSVAHAFVAAGFAAQRLHAFFGIAAEADERDASREQPRADSDDGFQRIPTDGQVFQFAPAP